MITIHHTYRKYLTLAILFLFIVPVSAQKTKQLTILHTNDVHSRFEAVEPGSANPDYADKGGFLRIAAYVNEERKENPELLLFDCGDFSQGTPYYNLFKGKAEIDVMNYIGYDACTIGNHEFDFGLENMAELFRRADFPIVCSNYDVSNTVLDGLIEPYIILKRNGIKIGVLGLGINPEGLVQEKNYEGLVYLDPYEKANEIAAFLKKEGCDIVICLSHLGLYSSVKYPVSDTELAQRTRNIDIILGGHSHSILEEPITQNNLDGKEVLISQMGKNGVYVGRVDLTLKKPRKIKTQGSLVLFF